MIFKHERLWNGYPETIKAMHDIVSLNRKLVLFDNDLIKRTGPLDIVLTTGV